MLPLGDRKIRMESVGKGLRYDVPVSYARKILVDLVLADHTYARASSLDPEFNRTHLTSLLFTKQEDAEDDDNDAVDVENIAESKNSLPIYDSDAGKKQMSELERCFTALQDEASWQEEDSISRIGWTRDQTRLFDQVYKILMTYRLARCSYEGQSKEQIMRSLAIKKATKRFRNVAGAVAWDSKLMSWLHTTLVDGINSHLFLSYLELLQMLKAKIPSLVDKMMLSSVVKPERSIVLSSPRLSGCLNKAWEPTPKLKSCKARESGTSAQKESSLENRPLLIMLPRGPSLNLTQPKRSKFWQHQLAGTGRVVKINILDVEKPEDFAVSSFLENVIGGTRSKISLFKSQFPGKPVILIGWSVGALLSCQIATLESVSGIVCLGYPSSGLDGVREVENYNCLEIRCPVMFVIGSHSSSCSAEFIEGLRDKMRVDTKLLIVEGGDEVLKLTSSQKRRLQVTQNMVDRLIMDEVATFIADVVARSDKTKESNRPDTPTSSSQSFRATDKKRKMKRLEMEKSLVDKKKPRLSPAQQQQKLQNKAKPKGVSAPEVPADGGNSVMAPNELTKAASQNLASGHSTLPSHKASSSDFKGQVLKNGASNAQASKLTVKGPHLKYGEKNMKKPKFLKKPQPMSRSLSTPPQQGGISQSDILAMQRFPSTSSVLLANSGAHLRFHDGRILRVSNADASKFQQSNSYQLSQAALKGQASIGNKAAIPGPMSADVKSVFTSASKTKAFPGFTNSSKTQPACVETTADARNATSKGESANASAGAALLSGTTLSTAKACHSPVSRAISAPAPSISTQLSPNDLKYLTDLFSKGQANSNVEPMHSNHDAAGSNKQAESPRLVPDSPISAKIGIGTLTNLPNADGSPPGSGTRLSPGFSLKPSPQKDIQSAESRNVKSDSEVPQPATIVSTPALPQSSAFIRKEISKGPRSTPVTITIPTYNTKSQVNASLKVSSVRGSGNAAVSTPPFMSHPSAKISQSKSAVELSQSVPKSLVPSLPSAVSTGRLSVASSAANPATLTVTSRQIQGSSHRGLRSPQTITLHIPNSAMLKDHKSLKSSGSEIKLIGFLNQKGNSPMSSPIHFSVQSKSNPGSPKPQSPSVFLTSKSDPPSPNPIKIIGTDKDAEAPTTTSLKQPAVSHASVPVPVSTPKQATTSSAKNGSASSKIYKPTSIQSALIKSLTAVSFSAKQKESIAHLLKSQHIVQGQDLKLPAQDASAKEAVDAQPVTTSPGICANSQTVTPNAAVIANAAKTNASSGTKLPPADVIASSIVDSKVVASMTLDKDSLSAQTRSSNNGASTCVNVRGSISFVSDNSVTTVVNNSNDCQGGLNGHGASHGKTHDTGISSENAPLRCSDSAGSVQARQDGREMKFAEAKEQSPRVKSNTGTAPSSGNSVSKPEDMDHKSRSSENDDLVSGSVNSGQFMRQKRQRDAGCLDKESASGGDMEATPNKRFTRRALSAGDGKGDLSSVQKTEE